MLDIALQVTWVTQYY